jgi:ribosomal peptide maturation radical SAM protein 1
MYRITLVNMPFASLNLSSIGLTQLRWVVEDRFKGQVSTDIAYVNQDFGQFLGINAYSSIASSADHQNSGIGDWFFRLAAFPELKDNIEEYFRRYYPMSNDQAGGFRHSVEAKRSGVEDFFEEIIARYGLDQADLVGFTSMFAQNVASFALARKIKERNPNAVIVMGGANCESPMGQEIAKGVSYIDYVFSGPGLKSFPELVQHCIDRQMDKCDTIKGVFSKTNCAPSHGWNAAGLIAIGSKAEAQHHHTLPSTHGEDLDIDAVIELDYDSFLESLQQHFPNNELKPILLFETSRGCWWGEKAHCTFCGLNGMSMNYRAMKPERAIELIQSMLSYYPKCTHFDCVDNIMPKEYLKEVFPFINPAPDVDIFYEVKADLSEEDIQTLAKARVTVIQPGIESLATSTLKLMKKGTSSFQNINFLKDCLLYGVRPGWNLLVGFPGEQGDVYGKYVRDIPLLMHLPPPSGVFPVRFDRYSPYFMQAKHYGLDLHPLDYYPLIYPFEKKSLMQLAYYFSDHNIGAKYVLDMAKWLRQMKAKHTSWVARWSGKDQALQAKLFMKRNGRDTRIYDSRSGEVVEHVLAESTARVLACLSKPRRVPEIASGLSSIPKLDLTKELGFLEERGLIFEENERFLSLVLPREPVLSQD